MRTKLFFGIVAMTLLNSCELIQNVEIPLDSETSGITFSAIIEDETSTKTALSDKTNSIGYYSLYWTKGDAISISDGENISIFTTESDGTSSGDFTPQKGKINSDALAYTAFYPSSITADHRILPAEQNYVRGNVENFPMYAKSYSRDLEFKNLCGIIRLSLKSETTGAIKVSSISLSADNAGMSGNFTVGSKNQAIVDGSDGVVLICKNAISLYSNLDTDFNIIVPAGDYNPLRIKICDADGKEVNLVSTDKIRVERGGITRISQTLGSSSFDSSLEMIPITESDVDFTDR